MRHAQGGPGEIHLAQWLALTLQQPRTWLLLLRRGDVWHEVRRAYGDHVVGARAFLDLWSRGEADARFARLAGANVFIQDQLIEHAEGDDSRWRIKRGAVDLPGAARRRGRGPPRHPVQPRPGAPPPGPAQGHHPRQPRRARRPRRCQRPLPHPRHGAHRNALGRVGRRPSAKAQTDDSPRDPQGPCEARHAAESTVCISALETGTDHNLLIRRNALAHIELRGNDTTDFKQPITRQDHTVWDNGNTPRSLGQNGYQQLPSGWIIQWGFAASWGSGDGTITFPIAFPVACRSVQATHLGPNNQFWSARDLSTTGFTIRTSSSANSGYWWFAIGR